MPRPRPLLVSLLLPSAFFLLPCLAFSDTLILHDGTRLEGRISRDGDDWLVTTPAGAVHRAAAADVKAIKLTGSSTTPDDRLASLRRAVENLPDINQILARYQQFIAQNEGAPAATQAARDVENWKQRQAQGYTRVAGRWLPPDQAAALINAANDLAARARIAIKDGDAKSADALLNNALNTDPNCAAALYLRGLRALQQNQLPLARKSFEQTADLVPDHAPTLNNLALTLFALNQYPAALTAYDQAMQARPDDPAILANVAEALNALPPTARNALPAKHAAQRLQQQQLALDPIMARQGLHRWGSGYITQDDYQRLAAPSPAAPQPPTDPASAPPSIPQYTHRQHPIGPEGAPLLLPPSPTTAPAR